MLDRVTYPRLTTNTHEKAIMQKYFLREKAVRYNFFDGSY